MVRGWWGYVTVEHMGLSDDAIARDRELSAHVEQQRKGRQRAGAVGPITHMSTRAAIEHTHTSHMTVNRRRRALPDEQPRLVVSRDGKRHPSRALDRDELGERDLAILTMRVEGMSIRVIAAEIGCSIGTVHRVIKAHPGTLRLLAKGL